MDHYIENSERDVTCPYCGERITVFVDTSVGTQQYVEDCQVCCRPIEFVVSGQTFDDLSRWLAGRPRPAFEMVRA